MGQYAEYAEREMQAALEFWRKYHSIGARARVRAAASQLRLMRRLAERNAIERYKDASQGW